MAWRAHIGSIAAAGGAVEDDAAGFVADRLEIRFLVGIPALLEVGHAVVADRLHGNEPRAPRLRQHFAQLVLVGAFGLGKAILRHEAVEDLTYGERLIGAILLENGLDVSQERDLVRLTRNIRGHETSRALAPGPRSAENFLGGSRCPRHVVSARHRSPRSKRAKA
jgi:hypothetical protein